MPEFGIDSLLSPLAGVIRRAPVSCGPATVASEALDAMRRLSIGSMIVVNEDNVPIGILTLRDVVDRIALAPGALAAPIGQLMTPEPHTLSVRESAYSAALAMVRHGVRHIVLVQDGKLAGLVSERDLFGLQSTGVRHLSTGIKGARDLSAVERFGNDIMTLARKLLEQGVGVGPLTAFIASLNDLLTQRIVELEFENAEVDGARYCWILMGSEGRTEQTLLTDQDNGMIFEPAPGQGVEEARGRLLPIARRINEALDRAGYHLCPGDIMAGNPSWCLSLAEWRDRFRNWIDSGSPEALLHGAIFFDLRPLTGELALGQELRAWLLAHAPKNTRFLHQMAANALRNRPPLGLLGDFATSKEGTIDLKVNGTTPFVDAARIYSLAQGVDATNTEARIRAVCPALGITEREAQAWIAAFYHVQGQRLKRQAQLLREGLPADNRIDPRTLHDFEGPVLKLAFKQARAIQRRLALDYRI